MFRITGAQLALRQGQVRCGQCRAVFDANDHLVKSGEAAGAGETSSPPEPQPEPVAVVDGPAGNAPSRAEIDEIAPATDEAPAAPPEETRAAPLEETREEETDATAAVPVQGPLARPRYDAWRPRKRLREEPRVRYALAIVVLVGLLAAQALFEFRDALAAHAPFTRPVLDAACRVAGCAVGPLRDASALSIEASELSADPAHKGLLKLTATVRNRAAYSIAYPYLELTLTDASDAVVARRAFAPSAYAAVADASGIAGNGEVLVTMFFDASGTSQAGYRLYLFYP